MRYTVTIKRVLLVVLVLVGAFVICKQLLSSQYVNRSLDGTTSALDVIGNPRGIISRLTEENYLHKAKQLVNARFSAEYIADLNNEITSKLTTSIFQQVRDSIQREYTEEYFKDAILSYSIYDVLKFRFLQSAFLHFTLGHIFKLIYELGFHSSVESRVNAFEMIIDANNEAFSSRQAHYHSSLLLKVLLANIPLEPELSTGELGTPFPRIPFSVAQGDSLSLTLLKDGHVNPLSQWLASVRDKHRNVVKMLKRMGEPSSEFVHGDGIVVYCGRHHLADALVTIGLLRDVKSELAIELVIAYESDYNEKVCNQLMELFNCRCIVIETIVGNDPIKYLPMSGDHLGLFGLMFTSFDNTIYMEAGTVPLRNVDQLIKTESYLETRCLLWPGLWHRTTSPYFYDVADIHPGATVRRFGLENGASWSDHISKDINTEVFFHDRENLIHPMTVDPRQFVFSKRKHFKSLMLAAYYMLCSKSVYYPLLYQAEFPEEPFDTFLPALTVLRQPYHLVQTHSWIGSYTDPSAHTKKFKKNLSIMHDPAESANLLWCWRLFLESGSNDPRMWPFQANRYVSELMMKFIDTKLVLKTKIKDEFLGGIVEIAVSVQFAAPGATFMRVNGSRINPIIIGKMKEDSMARTWGMSIPSNEFGSTDWELKVHSVSKWLACGGIDSALFWQSAGVSQVEACEKATTYVKLLENTAEKLAAGSFDFVDD